ncbi:MAG: hypothetical protein EKK55_20085 [Rhodocyclaceae bacterium]|nr:MAG: hypothetical protein EKK55_20085 [Rhodocyclaceae bacterium]
MKAPQTAKGAPGPEGAGGPESGPYGATSEEDAGVVARAEARRQEHTAVLRHDINALEAHLRAKRAELAALREGTER